MPNIILYIYQISSPLLAKLLLNVWTIMKSQRATTFKLFF